jgi:hypothetical protein
VPEQPLVELVRRQLARQPAPVVEAAVTGEQVEAQAGEALAVARPLVGEER